MSTFGADATPSPGDDEPSTVSGMLWKKAERCAATRISHGAQVEVDPSHGTVRLI